MTQKPAFSQNCPKHKETSLGSLRAEDIKRITSIKGSPRVGTYQFFMYGNHIYLRIAQVKLTVYCDIQQRDIPAKESSLCVGRVWPSKSKRFRSLTLNGHKTNWSEIGDLLSVEPSELIRDFDKFARECKRLAATNKYSSYNKAANSQVNRHVNNDRRSLIAGVADCSNGYVAASDKKKSYKKRRQQLIRQENKKFWALASKVKAK